MRTAAFLLLIVTANSVPAESQIPGACAPPVHAPGESDAQRQTRSQDYLMCLQQQAKTDAELAARIRSSPAPAMNSGDSLRPRQPEPGRVRTIP